MLPALCGETANNKLEMHLRGVHPTGHMGALARETGPFDESVHERTDGRRER